MIDMTDETASSATADGLTLETREQANETPVIANAVALTPLSSEDYWSYRVRLSDTQAVLGFPKFSTIGIGFAVESDSWNTNLPYHCATDEILAHIIDNKGDDEIDDADVREAILMIQLAVIDDLAISRRKEFNDASHAVPVGAAMAPGKLFEQVIRHLETSMRETRMLRAEVDRTRNALAAQNLDAAYWRGKYEGAVMDDLAADAGPGVLPDGGHPFVALLLRRGVPTKDNRLLSVDGAFELPTDAPLLKVVDEEISYSPSDVVGRIVGLWHGGNDIYAVGVADRDIADALNSGRLMLGADLDADIPEADPLATSFIPIRSGRVRSARVSRPEAFAWEI